MVLKEDMLQNCKYEHITNYLTVYTTEEIAGNQDQISKIFCRHCLNHGFGLGHFSLYKI